VRLAQRQRSACKLFGDGLETDFAVIGRITVSHHKIHVEGTQVLQSKSNQFLPYSCPLPIWPHRDRRQQINLTRVLIIHQTREENAAQNGLAFEGDIRKQIILRGCRHQFLDQVANDLSLVRTFCGGKRIPK